ncbi:pilus assembly FimT family protein [Rhodopirellula bahusiensis]|nr:prepilin-type N-terminal cleavage/methylation domain-containing protein [Rhodopirellula bahusiensis]
MKRTLLRSGFTLVELMIALAIITLLTSIALPTVKNTLREQQVSRSATLFQSVIEEARARSIATGGGGGIIIDRIGGRGPLGRSQAIRMRFATTPAPYSGEGLGDRGLISVGFNPAGVTLDTLTMLVPGEASQLLRSARDIDANPNKRTLINPGDIIQLGDNGMPAEITGIGLTATSDVMLALQRIEPNSNFRRFHNQQVQYRILRSPTPAIAMPTELSQGAAIDLTSSGIGRYGNEFSPMEIEGNYIDTTALPFVVAANRSQVVDYGSIWILFGARGEVSRVLSSQRVGGALQLQELPVLGDIHFLVSRSGELKVEPNDQLEDTDGSPFADDADDGTTPLLNNESIWVTIKSRNGEVVSSSWTNPFVNQGQMIPPGPPTDNVYQSSRIRSVIGAARTAAVEARDLGSN